ncbi:MAG: hypothetical protein R3E96_01555 [Planctomycetota bacterium]
MRYGFQPGYQDSYLYPYPLEQWQVVVPECNVIVQRGESRFALQLGQDYYLAPSARSERDVQQRASGLCGRHEGPARPGSGHRGQVGAD